MPRGVSYDVIGKKSYRKPYSNASPKLYRQLCAGAYVVFYVGKTQTVLKVE